eukprot:s985_g18.t3
MHDSSQGLQKSAADALRRFGLGGYGPQQGQGQQGGNWMGNQQMQSPGASLQARNCCAAAAGHAAAATAATDGSSAAARHAQYGERHGNDEDHRDAVESLRQQAKDADPSLLEWEDQDAFASRWNLKGHPPTDDFWVVTVVTSSTLMPCESVRADQELLAYLRAVDFDQGKALARMSDSNAWHMAMRLQDSIWCAHDMPVQQECEHPCHDSDLENP